MEDFECQSGGGWKETTPQDTQVQSFLPQTGQIHSVWWLLPCPLDEIEDNALWPTCSILFTSVMKKKKCNSPKFQILLKVKTSFLSQIWGVSIFSVWSSTSLFLNLYCDLWWDFCLAKLVFYPWYLIQELKDKDMNVEIESTLNWTFTNESELLLISRIRNERRAEEGDKVWEEDGIVSSPSFYFFCDCPTLI